MTNINQLTYLSIYSIEFALPHANKTGILFFFFRYISDKSILNLCIWVLLFTSSLLSKFNGFNFETFLEKYFQQIGRP